jgi:murein tripeptide amidase MpaA
MTPLPSETFLGKDKRKSINLSPINRTVNLDNHNRSIVVLGRMAGSDVNGSFIIEGMVDYLMDNVEFESMKRVFDFYFVPLANIDGVRYGNTVTNLTGSLLNNNWKIPHRSYQA